MNQRRRLVLGSMLGVALLAVAPAGFAIGLDDAKAQGLVGEMVGGYLGAVQPPSAAVQQLIDSINAKRRAAYQDIATSNRTSLQAVEALAGKKAIQKTRPGQFVNAGGGWIQK